MRVARRVLVALVLLLCAACPPVRVALPVRGEVVDGVTGLAVPDAIVELRAHTTCPGPHTTSPEVDVSTTHTDRNGKFLVGGGFSLVFPCIGWNNNILVLAPGYQRAGTDDVVDSIALGIPWPKPFFVPTRFALDRFRYRQDLLDARGRDSGRLKSGIRSDYEEAINRLAYAEVAPPGVFASRSGATFERLIARYPYVYARTSTGAILGWNMEGRPAPGIEHWAEPRSSEWDPTGTAIWEATDKLKDGHWLSGDEAGTLRHLLDRPSHIVCAGSVRNYAIAFVTKEPDGYFAYAAYDIPDLDRRKLFRRKLEGRTRTSRSISACAFAHGVLFVAFEEDGIRVFGFPSGRNLGIQTDHSAENPRSDAFWARSSAVALSSGSPKTFTALAFEDVPEFRLYGVARDAHIYRFAGDGTPDQRIELKVPMQWR